MNVLIDPLPNVAEDAEHSYPIETDFRAMIRLELLLTESTLPEHEKILEALRIFYKGLWPRDVQTAMAAMMDFYRANEVSRPSHGKSERRVYSYEQDAPYIYAAFFQQYGINLNAVEYMHWFEFRALFHALGEQTQFVKIMGYRSADTSKMSKETRAEYARLKKLYALHAGRDEQEKTDALEEALMRGEIPEGLV